MRTRTIRLQDRSPGAGIERLERRQLHILDSNNGVVGHTNPVANASFPNAHDDGGTGSFSLTERSRLSGKFQVIHRYVQSLLQLRVRIWNRPGIRASKIKAIHVDGNAKHFSSFPLRHRSRWLSRPDGVEFLSCFTTPSGLASRGVRYCNWISLRVGCRFS